MKKLILIEGLPGTGKSTTAQWLHHSFRQSNISSRWLYELSDNHPLTTRSEIGEISAGQLVTESMDLWRRFVAADMRGYDVIIIDSVSSRKTSCI